jgi:mRNA-degrading endonuclease YafQ of YafQ-DinJ toxin-antitoxin module
MKTKFKRNIAIKIILLGVFQIITLKCSCQVYLEIFQRSYIGSDHFITLTDKKLIVRERKWIGRGKRFRETTKTIYKRRIRDSKKLIKLIKLLQSEEFRNLDEEYESGAIDGVRWEYEIKIDKRVQHIKNENDYSVQTLFRLHQEINNIIEKKKGRVLYVY